ncbi:MAG TPA: DUF664 domain-containing protein [Acidimicrobiales bacterium]
MTIAEMLQDVFGRVRDIVHDVVDGSTPEELSTRVGGSANSIAWLVWHLTRVQDDHVVGAVGAEQVWTSMGWAQRFALPFAVEDTGYGHGPDEVAAVKAGAELLLGYHDAVCAGTLEIVGTLVDADLDRIVDEHWDPPVTMGVRLVSVIADVLQHAGQAAFVRGIL